MPKQGKSIAIDEQTHHKLKVAAATSGKSMQQIAEKAIKKELEREQRRG